jgi:hypothetical protein
LENVRAVVPREQTYREKMKQMGLSSQYLLRYADEEDIHVLNMILTEDE